MIPQQLWWYSGQPNKYGSLSGVTSHFGLVKLFLWIFISIVSIYLRMTSFFSYHSELLSELLRFWKAKSSFILSITLFISTLLCLRISDWSKHDLLRADNNWCLWTTGRQTSNNQSKPVRLMYSMSSGRIGKQYLHGQKSTLISPLVMPKSIIHSKPLKVNMETLL
jgi:hypothetical protein